MKINKPIRQRSRYKYRRKSIKCRYAHSSRFILRFFLLRRNTRNAHCITSSETSCNVGRRRMRVSCSDREFALNNRHHCGRNTVSGTSNTLFYSEQLVMFRVTVKLSGNVAGRNCYYCTVQGGLLDFAMSCYYRSEKRVGREARQRVRDEIFPIIFCRSQSNFTILTKDLNTSGYISYLQWHVDIDENTFQYTSGCCSSFAAGLILLCITHGNRKSTWLKAFETLRRIHRHHSNEPRWFKHDEKY